MGAAVIDIRESGMARQGTHDKLRLVFQPALFRLETLASFALDENAEVGGGDDGGEVGWDGDLLGSMRTRWCRGRNVED